MIRFWTSYWKCQYWDDSVNREHVPLERSGNGLFPRRGVREGDVVFVVSVSRGHLLLGGRLQVDRVLPREDALAMTGRSHLHDDAKYWVIGRGTLLHLHRRLSYDVTKTLRFVPTDNGSFLAPTFAPGTKKLEPQSVRTVRELWCRSAQLLIEVIDHTDTEERTRRSVVVTPKYLKDHNLGVRAGAARPTRSG